MTLVERIVASLATHHDRLAGLVDDLDEHRLTVPSAATQWRVCDVLSHLGSGAEIAMPAFTAAISGTPAPDVDNQSVWGRWDAMSPRAQAIGFTERDKTLVDVLVELDAERHDEVRVDLGFLPEPVPLAVAAGMRLNEVALHAWDVEAGLDRAATLDEDAAGVLLELYAGPMSFLLGFVAKPDALPDAVVVAADGWTLRVGDTVTIEKAVPGDQDDASATFTGPAEAFVRLVGGRLTSSHTADDVSVGGAVGLDDLRRVFPGF